MRGGHGQKKWQIDDRLIVRNYGIIKYYKNNYNNFITIRITTKNQKKKERRQINFKIVIKTKIHTHTHKQLRNLN